MSSSTCSLDFIPTHIFKDLPFSFYPKILELINISLTTPIFFYLENSFISPTVKRFFLDLSLPTNYRHMSNLSFISKLLQKVVYFQFLLCFEANNLLLFTPSGFFFTVRRPHLKIYNDFLLSCDKGNISLFLCLDFSSAFDTVDHFTLIQQLENFFGISGSCLKWISSNISNWSFVVSINNSHSTSSSFPFGVSQGFFLGSFFYSSYF